MSFIFGIYAIVVSSYMPDTGIWVGYRFGAVYFEADEMPNEQILDVIKRDEHYKYFIPSCIPAGLVFVIVNWGGLHYFRHA